MIRSPIPIGARVRFKGQRRTGTVTRWWKPWAQVRVIWDDGSGATNVWASDLEVIARR